MKGLDPDLRSLQEVRDHVARAKAACEAVAGYSQERIDRLCEAVARAGAAAAHDLARLAVEETGIGRVYHKVLKNLLGSEGVWESIRDERTVGIVSRDEARGLLEVATPVGVVAGVVPTTNPTSTALFKALIALKGRNAIVISPHPRARRCIGETIEVVRRAIERAGGPPDLATCLANPTIESTGALMKHRDVAIILSTGGAGLVRAAYSSGKPAYGVGPGNVPAYVDRSADAREVAADLVGSQAFDNGTLCCSEQALVVDRPLFEPLLAELRARGAYFCSEEETRLLERHCVRDGHMNPAVVGLDPWRIAEAAGFQVPRETSLLLAGQDGVGEGFPLSIEILCPLLSVHVVDGWREGCEMSKAILHYGGLGHTMAVHARDEAVLEAFFLEKPASRICANGPTSQGAVGFSTHLVPSMSLGCGPQAGNITSDNISARHLINLKRVAFKRRDWAELERRYGERAAALTGEAAPRGSGLRGDPALKLTLKGGVGGAGSFGRGTRAGSAAPSAASNWRGNPAVVPNPTAAPPVPPSAPDVRAGVLTRPAAPTFTGPPRGQSRGQSRSQSRGPSWSPSGGAAAAAGAAAGTATGLAPAPPRPAPPRSAPPRPAPPRSGPPHAGTPPGPGTVEVGAGLSVVEIEKIMDHAGAGCPMGPCKGCPHLNVRSGACTA